MTSTLIIGYGNPDREDDGLAWHVLVELAARLGRRIPGAPEEGFFPEGLTPDLWFVLQLVPEMAEDFAKYDRLCFVDAHTGDISEEIWLRTVEESQSASAFTHHVTPATCLALVHSLYQKFPEAQLLSMRGEAFRFSRELSPAGQNLVNPAVELLQNWLEEQS